MQKVFFLRKNILISIKMRIKKFKFKAQLTSIKAEKIMVTKNFKSNIRKKKRNLKSDQGFSGREHALSQQPLIK